MWCLKDGLQTLVVGESQGSCPHSVGKYPVKPLRLEGDSQTIDTYRCRKNLLAFSINDIFTGVAIGIRTCIAEVYS